MKKLLFGLLAISAVTFAANPDPDPNATPDAADINVQATLTVVAPSTALVIEELLDSGVYQPVSSTIVFDHGTVIAGETPSLPNIAKNFRVRRTDNSVISATADKLTITAGSNAENPFIGPDADNDINHKFFVNQAAQAANDTTTNFVVTSSITTPVIPYNSTDGPLNQTPGVYQKLSTITATVTP